MEAIWSTIIGVAQSLTDTLAQDVAVGIISAVLASGAAVVLGRFIALRAALRRFVLGVSARKRAGSFVIALLPFVNDKDGSIQRSILSQLETEFRAFGAMTASQTFEVITVPFRARPDEHFQTRGKDLDRIRRLIERSGADVAVWGWQVRDGVANVYFLGQDHRSIPLQVDFTRPESQREFDRELSATISLIVAAQANSVLNNPEGARIERLRSVAEKMSALAEHDAPAFRDEALAKEFERLNLRLQEELGRRTERIVEIESAIDVLRRHQKQTDPESSAWAENAVKLADLIAATGWQVSDASIFSEAFRDLMTLLDREALGAKVLQRARLLCAGLYDRALMDQGATLPPRLDLYNLLKSQANDESEVLLIGQLLFPEWAIKRAGLTETLTLVKAGLVTTPDGHFDQVSTMHLYRLIYGYSAVLIDRHDGPLTLVTLERFDSLLSRVHPSFRTLFQIARLHLLTSALGQAGLSAEQKDALTVASDNLAASLLTDVERWGDLRHLGQYILLERFASAISNGKISSYVIDHFDRIRIGERVLEAARKVGETAHARTVLAVTLNNAANKMKDRSLAVRANDFAKDIVATTPKPSIHNRYVLAYASIVLLELTEDTAPDFQNLLTDALENVRYLESMASQVTTDNDRSHIYDMSVRIMPWRNEPYAPGIERA
jgi:hypothetical protein